MNNDGPNIAILEAKVDYLDEAFKSMFSILQEQQKTVSGIITSQKLMQQTLEAHVESLTVARSDIKSNQDDIRKLEADRNRREGGKSMIIWICTLATAFGTILGAAAAILVTHH
ncbi:MAG: hypothetical protein KGL39_30260 [Patescibacteria group bacterium]|nr:hypothetical protein [Patescibacteria group bacterium]